MFLSSRFYVFYEISWEVVWTRPICPPTEGRSRVNSLFTGELHFLLGFMTLVGLGEVDQDYQEGPFN